MHCSKPVIFFPVVLIFFRCFWLFWFYCLSSFIVVLFILNKRRFLLTE